MKQTPMKQIVEKFNILGDIESVKPLGNGLINSTYKVNTVGKETPDYVSRRGHADEQHYCGYRPHTQETCGSRRH